MTVTSEKIKIQPNTVQETLMLPLYGRVYCAKHYPSVFPDPLSVSLAEKVDYDFDALSIPVMTLIPYPMRQRILYEGTRDYLKIHPKATVVDLGCGLDASFPNFDNGECKLLNLDLSDVIDARNELLPAGEREENLGGDAFDFSWMEKIEHPEDGVCVITAGMLFYIEEKKIKSLFLEIVRRFPNARIIFDTVNAKGMKMSNKIVERSGNGSRLQFSVEDPKKLFPSWSKKLSDICVIDRLPTYIAKCKEIPFSYRLMESIGFRMGMMRFVQIDVR